MKCNIYISILFFSFLIQPVEGWKTKLTPASSPHIICLAQPLKQGEYYVCIHDKLIFCGHQAARAVDILIKSFAVLGLKPSGDGGIAKLVEFVEIFTYQVTLFSSRSKVNSLVSRLREMDADEGAENELLPIG